MPNEREDLAGALLETNNLFNKITALQMNGIYNQNVFDLRKDAKVISKIEKKVYKIFLKLLVPEIAKRLTEIDTLTESIIAKVEDRTGWSITEYGAFKEDNILNMANNGFESWDTYQVQRNKEMGFYVDARETYSPNEDKIRETEQQFYSDNKATLDRLHELMSEKEHIMSGTYSLKDPTPENERLAQLISIYLNYQPSQVFEKEEKSTMSM